eukprot:c15753_g1_i1 orf=70-3639(-)
MHDHTVCAMETKVLKLFILAAFFYSMEVSSLEFSRMLESGTHLTDMQLLLQFKQQVQQDPYGIMATWVPSNGGGNEYNSPCSWNGVSCSLSQRVVRLELRDADLQGSLVLSTLMAMDMLELVDLSGNQFYGNLTSGFFNTPQGSCGNLQTIILANNYMHGSIPSDLLACGNIQQLDISHNNLTGIIPSTFFLKCGSLKLLDLSHNRLKGRLPTDISQCTHLQQLNLSFNSLLGELPLDILTTMPTSSSGLQILDLSSNNLSGPISDMMFDGCGSIISINLSHNAFSGEVSSSIESCATLQELNFSNNRLVGRLPASLGGLKSIKILDISSNHITGAIPDELGNTCSTLEHLHLSTNNISGTVPSSFRSCASLQTLNLAKNKLTGTFPGNIVSHLKGLESLVLAFNQLSGPLPTEVANCSNLKVLDLSSNKLIGKVLPQICPPSSALEVLLLPNNGFSGEVPAALANCSRLKVLDLSFNQLEGAIPPELGFISGMESLLLWFNKLTGKIPKELGGLPQLKTLVLNNNLLSGAIPQELSNCSAMEWMCLSSNSLTGSIPAFIGAMQQLTLLELGNNSLSGHIPLELANASKLIWVDLNSNYLDGPIPPGLGRHPYGNVTRLRDEFAFVRNLGYKCRGLGILLEFGGITEEALSSTPLRNSCNLTRLYVEDSLNGDSDFSTIQYLDLSYNMLEGKIPDDMGYLTALQMLSLAHNQLVGPIPLSFSHLRSIGVLDLSYNKLEGGVTPLANCSFLVQIDVSNNNLSGIIPNTGQLSTAPVAGFLNNTGLCGEPLPLCSSSSNLTSGHCDHDACLTAHDRLGILPWANSIVLGILIAVAVMCMLIIWGIMMRSKKAEKHKDTDLLNGLQLASCQGNSSAWNIGGEKEPLSINVATFERPLRKLTFAQLIEATNGFSQDSLVGVGGFGEVYKAELPDGSVVAIKKLLQSSYQGDREFIAEMETLGKIKHKNLVPLLGYCKVGEERLLVYEYMHGGSLDDMLHGDDKGNKEKLTWETRKQIAKGAARGLAFLHHNCIPHIIHRDMKSSNVLLDKSLEARVSDFGMARLISALDTHLSVSTLAGTPGYVPPEYCQSFRCTTKGDVYSFGVILLELLTGKRPTDKEEFEDSNLVGWVRKRVMEKRALEVLDGSLGGAPQYEMLQYLRVACDCVEDLPPRRPSMQHVLTMLKELEVNGPV